MAVAGRQAASSPAGSNWARGLYSDAGLAALDIQARRVLWRYAKQCMTSLDGGCMRAQSSLEDFLFGRSTELAVAPDALHGANMIAWSSWQQRRWISQQQVQR